MGDVSTPSTTSATFRALAQRCGPMRNSTICSSCMKAGSRAPPRPRTEKKAYDRNHLNHHFALSQNTNFEAQMLYI